MRIGKRDLQYKTLQGLYWMLYGLSTAFVTVFLLSKGFSSSSIGVIVAISNGFAAAGQMLVGTLVDKYKSITWKGLIILFCIVEFVCLGAMMLFTRSMVINGLMFPLFSVLLYFQMPLVNAALFYYTQRGERIDFGSARGMGSLTYAFMSFIAGQLIVRFGEQSLIYMGVILLVAFMAITMSMPYYKDEIAGEAGSVKGLSEADPGEASKVGMAEIAEHPEAEQDKDAVVLTHTTESKSFVQFIKGYPAFMLMCFGVVLVMAFHNIIHTYMIQMMEAIGGDSGTMGTAFSWEAIVELPVMFGFFILIKNFKSNILMMCAGVGFFIKAICVWMAGSVLAMYGAESLQMISYAVLASASVYYANDQMDEGDRVKGQGYITAAMAAGGILGNFSGGFIYDNLGLGALKIAFVVFAAAGAVLMTLSGLKSKAR